jgi:exosortase/archaeosortase family protein
MSRVAFPLLLAALCAAFWPVWRWYALGTVDGSNDSAGLLAVVAAVVIVLRAPAQDPIRMPLLLPTVCLLFYAAATAAGLALSTRAVIVAVGVAALVSAFRLGKRIDVALLALCVLALPLAATLQFYVGYPLRVLAGDLSVLMLRMNGLAVVREGATLAWDGQLISIDAPCSGLKMLWAGVFLACALAASANLSALRSLAAVGIAAVVVVAANAVRASALFYMETGLIGLPQWAHGGMGIVCFAGAAVAILAGVHMVRGRTQ